MSYRYAVDAVRRNTRRAGPLQLTSKAVLLLLALVGLGASAVYWWGVQSTLYPDRVWMAMSYTAIVVLAPPTLISFLIPWSPAGMLLKRINQETSGHIVVVACSIYLCYYSVQIEQSWQLAQPVVATSGLVWQQVIIGLIGFIIIPALLWAPVSSDELVEQAHQAHLVKRYELQTQADIAILRATLLRAQEKALIGFANLTVGEKEELAAVMRSLVGGIDKTLREVGHSVEQISGAALPFDSLDDNDDIREILNYMGESLTGSTLHADRSVEQSVMAAAGERHALAGNAPVLSPPVPAAPPRSFQDAIPIPPPSRPDPSPQRPAALRRAPQRYAAEYESARSCWPPPSPFTAFQLGQAFDKSERTARDWLHEWTEAGLVARGGTKNNWHFTE